MSKLPTTPEAQQLLETLQAGLVALHDSELVDAIKLLGQVGNVQNSATAIADEVGRRLRVTRLQNIKDTLNNG